MRLLDLFCGGGGAAMGYYRAGFTEIVGVDNKPHKNYPFGFVQADALEYLGEYGVGFDAIHASPPCQAFVAMANRSKHKDLLTPTLKMMVEYDCPWVVENVPTAPMPATVILCGSSFGLRVRRHRKFASNVLIPSLPCRHEDQKNGIVGVYGSFTSDKGFGSGVVTVCGNPRGMNAKSDFSGGFRHRDEASEAMGGIDWMSTKEMAESIPPAYTEYIGRYLLEYLGGKK